MLKWGLYVHSFIDQLVSYTEKDCMEKRKPSSCSLSFDLYAFFYDTDADSRRLTTASSTRFKMLPVVLPTCESLYSNERVFWGSKRSHLVAHLFTEPSGN